MKRKRLAVQRDGPVASFEVQLRDPNAPWLPSSSEAIDYRAFRKVPERYPWWKRWLTILFTPWRVPRWRKAEERH